MKTAESASILRTAKYRAEWQEGDDKPPPGYNFAKMLLEELKKRGASSNIDELKDDYWEHQNWYFWLEWSEEKYNFRVEHSMLDDKETLWHVGVSRSLGMIKTLFGKGKEQDQIDVALRDATTQILEDVGDAEEITWMAHDDALDILYGTPASKEEC